MEKRTIKVVVCSVILIILAILSIGEFLFFNGARGVKFEDEARAKLNEVGIQLDCALTNAQIFTDSIISHTPSSRLLEKERVKSLIAQTMDCYPIDGLFFTIRKGSDKGYSLLYSRQCGFIDIPEGDHQYDVYDKTSAVKNKAIWSAPDKDELLGERVVSCCVPFDLESGERGIVKVIYNTTHIYKRLQELGLSRYGFPYILDSQTMFIAHPLDEIRSLAELASDYNDAPLARLADDLLEGTSTDNKSYIHYNTATGQKCNELIVPMAQTGWMLGLSVYDGHSLESDSYRWTMKRTIIRIIIFAALLLIIIGILINNTIPNDNRPGIYHYLFPFIFIVIIICVIMAYDRFPINGSMPDKSGEMETFIQGSDDISQADGKWDPQRIVDSWSLAHFIESYSELSDELYGEPVKIIPTGVYIQTIQFHSSYDVRVAGYVWQKYIVSNPSDDHSNGRYQTIDYASKGIVFPGARINSYELTDSLNIFINNYPAVLYRWVFDIDVPQRLDHSLFPFGKNDIRVPLWSTDLDDNTIMIPDLDSYKQTYPDICPGLGNGISVSGWDILNSYYSYSMESYLCDFGNTDMRGINRFPELFFNVLLSRKFFDSLVCKIIPLTVVLVLLFTILFVRNESDGFNNVIGCSGLFFVLVFDHVNLRESVASGEIMYLEYCYFFTYLLLLLITVTSFRIDVDSRLGNSLKIIDLFMRRYFWAIIFGLMTIATVFKFY